MANQGSEGTDRRTFVKQVGSAILVAGMDARSYARILGANDRIRLGQLGCGLRSYGHVHMAQRAAKKMPVETVAVCDIWSLAREQRAAQVKEVFGARAAILQVLRGNAGTQGYRRRDDRHRRLPARQAMHRRG